MKRPAAFLAVLLGGAVVPAAPPSMAQEFEVGEVDSLHFGNVLFHHYLDDHGAALTRYLAWRDAGRLGDHAASADLLAGGLFLQYGLPARAEATFERLLADTGSPALRDHLWFEVGRVRQRQGQHVDALAAFARVGASADAVEDGAAPPADLPLYLARSHMALGRFADAAAVLDGVEGPASLLPFVRYNLGVALVRIGEIETGLAQLQRVGAMIVGDEAGAALRDRANLALGYALLQQDAPAAAIDPLRRVRLDGSSANRALLGLGWARSAQGDPRGALAPWRVLGARDAPDSAILEARLAVPHALAQLDDQRGAAQAYEAALGAFDAELARLDEAAGALADEAWLRELLDADASQALEAAREALGADGERSAERAALRRAAEVDRWRWQLGAVPDSDVARYLRGLLASNALQEGLRNYRDLVAFDAELDRRRRDLEAFDAMVEAQREAGRTRAPRIAERLGLIDPDDLRARRDALAERLARIAATRDVVGLATEAELDSWRWLEELGANPALAQAPAATQDRHRLLRGHLLWQLDREYDYRLWQQREVLAGLDASLADVGPGLARVRGVRAGRPEDLDAFAMRIDGLGPRLDALRARLDATRVAQVRVLRERAEQALGVERRRLLAYRVQATFALATLYDRAATGIEVAGPELPAPAAEDVVDAPTARDDVDARPARAADDAEGTGP